MSGDVEAMEAVLRRLDTHERNLSDLAGSHGRLVYAMSSHEKRLASLEDARQETREHRAGQAEREKTMQRDLRDILEELRKIDDLNLGAVKADVATIKDGNGRMFWLVAGTIVSGFGALIFVLINRGLFGV